MGRIMNPGYINGLNIKNEIENKQKSLNKTQTSISFEDLLKKEAEELKFSAHASRRLNSRNIKLSEEDIERLQGGIDKIREKGGKESVVLMDDTAFVVSVKNNTVVTVIDEDSLKDNVFTNIDSMVKL